MYFVLAQSFQTFAYREAYAPLLCAYLGGSLSHKTTPVQACRGFRLLTLASYNFKKDGEDKNMSVVIIGGNERMVCQYADICKCHGCKAKVFAKEHGSVRKKIGCPDLLILFTNTVSHKMVNTAIQEAKRNNIPVARIHSSSASALHSVLEEHCVAM